MNLTMFGLGEPRRSSLSMEKAAFERRGSFADRLSAEAAAHRRGSTEMLDRLRDARWKLFDKERFKDRRGSLSQERLDQRPPAGRAAGLKLEDSRTRTLDRDKTGRRGGKPEPGLAFKLEDEKTRTLDRDKTGRRVKVERRGSIVTRWYRLIKEAADSYQGRDGKGHKRTESAHTLLQAQDSSEAPAPSPAAADDPADGSAATAGAEAALSPGAGASPADASPAQSPTAPRSQLTPKAAAAATAAGGGADGAASPGEKRRMQRVEMLKIAECTRLIDPAEVVVSQGVVLSAEPVLTPIERLRRKDEQVRQTLAEKQQLVADILQIPRDDFEHIAELAAESGGEKDARELILNSILSVDRNMSIINETLKVTEGDIVSSTCTPGPPESPVAGAGAAEGGGPRRPVSPRPRRADRSHMAAIHQLLQVNSQLSATLTTLLGVMTERDEERERMRKELRYSHERIHQLHRESAAGGALAASPAPQTPPPAPLAAPETDTSRPHSFVSVASSSDAPAASGGGSGGPAEHAETDDESSRSRPDTGSQESGDPASDTLEESTHETETFDSASSGSACLTFESAADHT